MIKNTIRVKSPLPVGKKSGPDKYTIRVESTGEYLVTTACRQEVRTGPEWLVAKSPVLVGGSPLPVGKKSGPDFVDVGSNVSLP